MIKKNVLLLSLALSTLPQLAAAQASQTLCFNTGIQVTVLKANGEPAANTEVYFDFRVNFNPGNSRSIPHGLYKTDGNGQIINPYVSICSEEGGNAEKLSFDEKLINPTTTPGKASLLSRNGFKWACTSQGDSMSGYFRSCTADRTIEFLFELPICFKEAGKPSTCEEYKERE